MPVGYWCPVLHAHLPYVRHPEYPEFLEEDWFFEALTETYVPLVRVLDGLLQDGVEYRLTMTLSPPLLSMMQDDLLVGRYHRYLDRLVELSHREIERTQRADARFTDVARFYAHEFSDIRRIFRDVYGSDIVRAFRKHRDAGKLEIITCGATHGFLPLMETVPQAVRAQVQVAVQHYRRVLGRDPSGIWLPECGYYPGVESYLREGGHPLQLPRVARPDSTRTRSPERAPTLPWPRPAASCSSPATWSRRDRCGAPSRATPATTTTASSTRTWGGSCPRDYLADFLPDGARKNLGLKYYRITGKVDLGDKQPYVRAWALEKAASHAGNFLENRQKQVEHLAGTIGRRPVVVSPYDAELFGHWWFEGPDFLNFLFRKMHHDQDVVKPVTPLEYLEREPELDRRAASLLHLGCFGVRRGLAEPRQRLDLPPPRRGRGAHGAAGPGLRAPRPPRAAGPQPGGPRAAPGPGLGLGLHHEDEHDGGVREEEDPRPHRALRLSLPGPHPPVHAGRADPAGVRGARQHLSRDRLPRVCLSRAFGNRPSPGSGTPATPWP